MNRPRPLLRRSSLRLASLLLAPASVLGALVVACSAAPGGEQVERGSQALSYPPFPPTTTSALGAADLANLYNIPTFLPANTTIAILTNDGDDPNADEDLAVYRGAFSLPGCSATSGCLTKVTETGSVTGLPASTGWAGTHMSEALDMASAGCPSCKLLVVEMNPSDPPTALITAIATAKSRGASALVSTAAWNLYGQVAPPDSTFTQPGITVFASLPFPGAFSALGYPASSPGVVAVGLTNASLGGTPMETAANAQFGPLCGTSPKPSWQHDTGCAGRTINDVAATSSPVWTFNTYAGGGGGWTATTGDQGPIVASSLVAAVFAQTGNGGAGPSFPYAHPAFFNDVSQGADGTCAGYLCNAVPGYDAPTGMGTPNGMNMAQINREFLDFSTSDINLSQPTLGSQGTHSVTIQAGQTLTGWVGTFSTWASNQSLSLSFSDPAFGVTAGMQSQTGTTEPGANFLIGAASNANPGTQSTMVISATAGGVTHSVAMELEIVPCVPVPTSCGPLQCGSVTNNCGQAIACAVCPSGDTCSNGRCCPAGEVGMEGQCCPAGWEVSSGHCCPADEDWLYNMCRKPPPSTCKGSTCT